MRRLLILTLTLLVALLPAAALADSDEKGGFSIRVNGDYRLPAEEEVEVLFVVDGNAEVAGTVHGALVVVNGDATVSGVVDGNITIVRGELELTDTAVVDDVQLIRSDLTRAPGATVRGDIDESDGWWAGWSIFFGIILLLGLAVALFVVAIGFALVGGKQLGEAATALTGKPLQTIVAGIVTVIGLPILAVLAMATLVGIWVGLSTGLIVVGIALTRAWARAARTYGRSFAHGA